MKLWPLALALLLAACTDDTPPHWEAVCVDSHSETTWQLMPIPGMGISIGSGMSLMPVVDTVCDRYEKRCMVGADYKGNERTCR